MTENLDTERAAGVEWQLREGPLYCDFDMIFRFNPSPLPGVPALTVARPSRWMTSGHWTWTLPWSTTSTACVSISPSPQHDSVHTRSTSRRACSPARSTPRCKVGDAIRVLLSADGDPWKYNTWKIQERTTAALGYLGIGSEKGSEILCHLST